MIAHRPAAAPPGLWAVLGLLLLLFLARSLVTFPIEHVDAAWKYQAAADIVRGAGLGEMLQNHHTLRWSEVLPQIVVTWATGFRYEGLYLLPLLAFALASALLWRGMAPVLSRPEQALLLGLLFLEPIGLQHTGQLLNPPFGVLYVTLAATVLARPGPPGWRRVLLAALCFFAAYGAHSTYLAFAAGGFAWLMFFERRPALAFVLAAAMVALIALETLAVRLVGGGEFGFGRLEVLAEGSHMQNVHDRFKVVEPIELLTRWLRLPAYDLALVAGLLGSSLWLAVDKAARRAAPPFLILCLLCGGAYAVAITIAVVDISPLRPVQPLRIMYLEPVMPFAAVGTVAAFAGLSSRLGRPFRLGLATASLAAMLGLLAVTVNSMDSWGHLVNYRMSAFAWRSHAEMSGFVQRFRDGEIMLAGRNRHALEKMIRYAGPVRVRRHGEVPELTTARALHPEARCVRDIRRIPLVRNEEPCNRRQLEAARSLDVRWKGEG